MARRFLVASLVGFVSLAALGCGDDGGGTGTTSSSDGVCGDGSVASGEQCDDGNTDDGDGCSATCQIEEQMGVCGDGTQDAGEQCDDGNTTDGDGCSSTCQSETGPECGDGNQDPDEDCDDGNMVAGDGCEPDCTITPEEVVCEDLPAVASGVCEVTSGGSDILIQGDILGPVTLFRGGGVVVDASGMITCVGCDCASQASGATRVVCPEGVVSPGLINAHDHITYVQNDPYTDTGERYEHRHDWRRGLNGHTEINASGGASSDAKRWAELRFVLSGATSTIGSGEQEGLLRNLDRSGAQRGLGQTPVDYDTFPLGDSNGTQLASGCGYPSINTSGNIASEDAYFPHVAEGIDAFARNEFVCIADETYGVEDLLEPQSAYIHAVGLTPMDYARMQEQGTNLIWSPRSNVTLYGDTAVVTAAKALGVGIALGTDWMPTGSMNLSRELACADELNTTYYDSTFSDRDLWHMVTKNAAEAAAMDDAIGVLLEGRVGDIAIFDASSAADHRAVIEAEPADTVLVLRGGEVLYGDDAVVEGLAPGSCDTLDVCGTNKRVCAQSEVGMSLSDLQNANSSLYGLFFCGDPPDEPSCTPMRTTSVNGSTIYGGVPAADDDDGDGLTNDVDNCVAVFNPIRPVDDGVQADFDMDGLGDACDPCPLNEDDANCPAYDAMDLDADGVSNMDDNCPLTPNGGQADGDNDDKGDVCDACPATSNPGALACPTTIYAIKTGGVSGSVALEDVLVTGCSTGNGFFLQYKSGDADYAGVENSGVFVYHPTVMCGSTLSVGDRVTLNPAQVNIFFDQIQLSNATVTVDSSLGEASPAPVVLTPAQASGTSPNAYEGVIATVENVLVTDANPTPGPGDSDPTNEFEVAGTLRVNDLIYQVMPAPAVNTPFASITGILNYRNGNQKMEPRDVNDVVLGPPILVGFGPQPAFVREGDSSVATIPDPLEVTLSGPVSSNTFVTVTSGTPASLTVVGGGVTIPNGSSSAPVLLNGLAQDAAVSLTASLDAVMMNADVRVVGAGETPQVVAVSPNMALASPGGMTTLEVFLDIPATPSTGDVVTLSLNPGTFGSVPSMVTVAADQLSEPFTFTATTMTGTETLTATLGGSMATATIDVYAGGGLLINEVDYDQPGTDTDEFVEIFNATASPINLSGLALVLVNGNGESEYNRIDLGQAGTLASGQYLVVGSSTLLAGVPGSELTIAFSGASNNIQNGAPDGLAILDTATDTLIDALSYEGDITMATLMGVTSMVSLVEGTGTPAADDNANPASLIRSPNGQDTDDASMDWALSSNPTPGATNMP
jgi:cysteine-rich repeat protein